MTVSFQPEQGDKHIDLVIPSVYRDSRDSHEAAKPIRDHKVISARQWVPPIEPLFIPQGVQAGTIEWSRIPDLAMPGALVTAGHALTTSTKRVKRPWTGVKSSS